MPERLLQFVPFLTTACAGGKPKLNTARLLELAITGAALIYAMQIGIAKLEVKMDTIEKHVSILDDRLYKHMEDSQYKKQKITVIEPPRQNKI